MGYLSKQLEKKAFNLAELLAGVTAAGGLGGTLGALNGEEGNQLASTLGGATGGIIGGAAGLPISGVVSDALDTNKSLARLLLKHPKLGKLLQKGAISAPILGLLGAGAYAGSAFAKKD